MKHRKVVELGVAIVVAIVVALLIQAFLVKPFLIPTSSMADTLRPGDRVLVDRVVFHLRRPRRGDIVVFAYPRNRDIMFIKRVIGLPGDTLETRAGRLYVNGRLLDEPYVHQTGGVRDLTNPSGPVAGTTMRDPWSLALPFTVGRDEYFVMGDNRTRSDDSRTWGTVPSSDIIGAGFFTYWPPGRLGPL
jgi:signal peptidase I